MERNWDFLEPFQSVLRSRLAFEPIPSPVAFSHIQHFGWMAVTFPDQLFANAPESWFSEWLDKLHDAIRLFALAVSLDKDAWRGVLGVQGFPVDELNVRYRLRVGGRLNEIRRLLLQRVHDQTDYNQAKEQLLQQSPSPHWPVLPLMVPVSLVITPDHWIDGLVGELIELWTLLQPSSDGNRRTWDDVRFKITDIQLHFDQNVLDITAATKDSVMKLLTTTRLPISSLRIRLSPFWSGVDVFSLVKAVDAAAIPSFKLEVATTEQYDNLVCALSGVMHIKSLEVGASDANIVSSSPRVKPMGELGASDVYSISQKLVVENTSEACSVEHLTCHASGPIPPILHGVKSLALHCDPQLIWRQNLLRCGSHLHSLALSNASSELPDRFDMASIIDICPHIKALELEGVALEGLDTLMRAYESRTCRITSITLRCVEILNPHSVERLISALGDPDSFVSQRLVELVWLDPVGLPPSVSTDMLKRVSTMLDQNYRLRLLEIDDSGFDDDGHTASHQSHHLKRLPAHLHSFISVVMDATKSQSAVSLLERDVLDQIFKFADVGERRRVILHHL